MTDITHEQLDARPSFKETVQVWWKIGLLSFGGPAAQIALMHKEIVEERSWLSEQQYLNALSFCMLLPGPEAMQLATYAGWRLHGVLGGLVAGLLFVLPGAFIIMALAAIYSVFSNVPLVDALFYGIKAAVLVIVIEALLRVSKRALSKKVHWLIAGLAFISIFFFSVPYPIIIFFAALAGWFMSGDDVTSKSHLAQKVTFRQTLSTIAIWLLVWALPFIVLSGVGAHNILMEIGAFFSKLAVVTFGGAYAVLAYMAQDVVTKFGWLTAGEMVDALGLAETTPGPLILVTQFVGFVAGFKDGGLLLAVATALVALWVTFVPCFLWIFAGAPYIEWISSQPRLRGSLNAITAAVVGVILNLSIWFALHVLFGEVTQQKWGVMELWQPALDSIEWLALGLFVLSSILAFKYHWSILRILACSSVLSCLVYPLI